MEKVTGIGGVFFRAKDPKKLSKWYEENLGVNPVPMSYDDLPWMQEEGPTVLKTKCPVRTLYRLFWERNTILDDKFQGS